MPGSQHKFVSVNICHCRLASIVTVTEDYNWKVKCFSNNNNSNYNVLVKKVMFFRYVIECNTEHISHLNTMAALSENTILS